MSTMSDGSIIIAPGQNSDMQAAPGPLGALRSRRNDHACGIFELQWAFPRLSLVCGLDRPRSVVSPLREICCRTNPHTDCEAYGSAR